MSDSITLKQAADKLDAISGGLEAIESALLVLGVANNVMEVAKSGASFNAKMQSLAEIFSAAKNNDFTSLSANLSSLREYYESLGRLVGSAALAAKFTSVALSTEESLTRVINGAGTAADYGALVQATFLLIEDTPLASGLQVAGIAVDYISDKMFSRESSLSALDQAKLLIVQSAVNSYQGSLDEMIQSADWQTIASRAPSSILTYALTQKLTVEELANILCSDRNVYAGVSAGMEPFLPIRALDSNNLTSYELPQQQYFRDLALFYKVAYRANFAGGSTKLTLSECADIGLVADDSLVGIYVGRWGSSLSFKVEIHDNQGVLGAWESFVSAPKILLSAGDSFPFSLESVASTVPNRIYGAASSPLVSGTARADDILSLGGSQSLSGGGGPDRLYGNPFFENTLDGGGDSDELYGGPLRDYLYGGSGNDTLTGGAGNDELYGGEGQDTYKFSLGFGTDTLVLGEGVDSLQFDASLSNYSLRAKRTEGGVLFTFSSGDQVLVQDWSAAEDVKVAFADGQVLSKADISALFKTSASAQALGALSFSKNNVIQRDAVSRMLASASSAGKELEAFFVDNPSYTSPYTAAQDTSWLLGTSIGNNDLAAWLGQAAEHVLTNSSAPRGLLVSEEALGIKYALLTYSNGWMPAWDPYQNVAGAYQPPFRDRTQWWDTTVLVWGAPGGQAVNVVQLGVRDGTFSDGRADTFSWWYYGGQQNALEKVSYTNGLTPDQAQTFVASRQSILKLAALTVDITATDALLREGILGFQDALPQPSLKPPVTQNGTDFLNTGGGSFGVDCAAPGHVPADLYVDATRESVTFRRELDSLVVELASGDSYRLFHFFSLEGGYNAMLRFKDGTAYSFSSVADDLSAQRGTDGNDVLSGGPNMWAGAGDDAVIGGPGSDVIRLEAGNDVAYGGGGNDSIYGGNGDDVLNGDEGDDLLYGDEGNDVLSGGVGTDLLSGGAGRDTLRGGPGADVLYGGDDADLLEGGAGDDVLDGENGNDVLDGGGGADTLIGGAGDDVLGGSVGSADQGYYSYGYVDPLAGNTYIGGPGNDTLNGTSRADLYLFDLGDGQDTIIEPEISGQPTGQVDVLKFGPGIAVEDIRVSRTGNDLVLAHVNGSDKVMVKDWFTSPTSTAKQVERVAFEDGTVWTAAEVTTRALTRRGTAGNDVLTGYASYPNTLYGLEGNDTLNGDSQADVLDGGPGNDTLNGNGGDDLLLGGEGDDILNGGAGNDILDGGSGANKLYGGDGNDRLFLNVGGTETLDGGAGIDTLDMSRISAPGSYWVNLGAGAATAQNWSFGVKYISGIENVDGSEQADIIQGDANNNVLRGAGGNDTLMSGAGNDTLDGGAGNDNFVIDGVGNKVVLGGTGQNSMQYMVNFANNPAPVTLSFNSNVLTSTAGNVEFQDIHSFYFNRENTSFSRDLAGQYLNVLDLGDGQNFAHLRNGFLGSVRGGADSDIFVLENVSSNYWSTVAGGAGIDTYKILGATQVTLVDDGLKWNVNGGGWFASEAIGDKLVLGDVTDYRQVTYQRQSDGSVWVYTQAGAQVLVKATAGDVGIEHVELADGVGVTWAQFLQNAYEVVDGRVLMRGTEGDDVLQGLEWMQNRLEGYGGDDTLIGSPLPDQLFGGTGNDVLDGRGSGDYLDGGPDNDTYVFRSGDGQDALVDIGGNDTLVFLGLQSSQASWTRQGADLLVRFGPTDSVLVMEWFSDAQRKVETFQFADRSISFAEIDEALSKRVITGTDGNDFYAPWNPLNDPTPGDILDRTFDLGAGDDVVFVYGGVATLTVDRSTGNDYVRNWSSSAADGVVLKLGASITPADVTIRPTWGGELLVVIGADEASVNVGSLPSTYQPSFTRVDFADGTSWSAEAIVSMTTNTVTSGDDIIAGRNVQGEVLFGDAGNDQIFGREAAEFLQGGEGDDYLQSGGGADTMDGGPGNDYLDAGQSANVTILFGADGGNDVVSLPDGQAGNQATLRLTGGLTQDDIELKLASWPGESLYADLVVKVKSTGATLTVSGYVVWDWGTNQPLQRCLDTIVFDDGTALSAADVWTRVQGGYDPTTQVGSSDDDWLGANGVSTTVRGLEGDDYLVGAYSPQSEILEGGPGNDTLHGGAGDVLRGGEGDDTLYADGDGDLDGGPGNDVLYGSGANDLFRYAAGEGFDTVIGGGGEDTLDFGGASFEQAVLTRDGDDLLVQFMGAEGAVRVVGQFTESASVRAFVFNGVAVDAEAVASQAVTVSMMALSSGDLWVPTEGFALEGTALSGAPVPLATEDALVTVQPFGNSVPLESLAALVASPTQSGSTSTGSNDFRIL